MKPARSVRLPSGSQVVRLSADCLDACLQREAGKRHFCQPRVCMAVGQLLAGAEIHAMREADALTFHVAHSSLAPAMILAVRFDQTAERHPDSIEIVQFGVRDGGTREEFALKLLHRVARMGADLGFRCLFYRGTALPDAAREWGFSRILRATRPAEGKAVPVPAEGAAGNRTPLPHSGATSCMEFELQPESLSWTLLNRQLAQFTPAG